MARKKGPAQRVTFVRVGAGDVRGNPSVERPAAMVWMRHALFPQWDLGIEFDHRARVIGYAMTARTDDSIDADVDIGNDGRIERGRIVPSEGFPTRSTRIPWGEIEPAARAVLRKYRTTEVLAASEVTRALDANGDVVATQPWLPDGGPGSNLEGAARKRLAAAAAEPSKRVRSGRPGRSDQEVVAVAARYAELVALAGSADPDARGAARRPIAVIAAESERDGRHLSTEVVKKIIKQARERGFLEPRTPGPKAAGVLTERAMRLMQQGADQ